MIFRLSALVFLMCASARTEEIFNGKDFTGWTFDSLGKDSPPEQVWSVKDRVIVCKGRPPGVMRTAAEHADFEFSLEWKWPEGTKPGNSGVLVRATTPRRMFAWPQSLEVQLAHNNAGDFWMIGETIRVGESKSLGRRFLKRQGSIENPPGTWNALRVRCEGDKVTVWVNGVLMNEGTGFSAKKGSIALQSEGTEIHFRNLKLVKLPENENPR